MSKALVEQIESLSFDEQVKEVLSYFERNHPDPKLKTVGKDRKGKLKETIAGVEMAIVTMGVEGVLKRIALYCTIYKSLKHEFREYAPGPYGFFSEESKTNSIHVSNPRMTEYVDPDSSYGKMIAIERAKKEDVLRKKAEEQKRLAAMEARVREMGPKLENLFKTLESEYAGGKQELAIRWALSAALLRAAKHEKVIDPETLRKAMWSQVRQEDCELEEFLDGYGITRKCGPNFLADLWEHFYMGPCWDPTL
jgi:hypothetical protein